MLQDLRILLSEEQNTLYDNKIITDLLLEVADKSQHLERNTLDLDQVTSAFTEYLNTCLPVEQKELSFIDLLDYLASFLNKQLTKEEIYYQYLAGGVHMIQLRYKIFAQGLIPSFVDHCKSMIKEKLYRSDLTTQYSEAELQELESIIRHDRDFNFHYAGSVTFRDKYITQYRVQQRYLETPQLAYMALSCTGFMHYPKSVRMHYVKSFYHAISNQKISLATPVLANVRGNYFSVSSCVCLDSEDSIESMGMTGALAMLFTAQRSGLGINVGRIRGLGTPIKKGIVSHSGLLPFLHYFHRAVKSCSQTGIRNGSATLFCPIFHLDIENYCSLKNTQGSHENRINGLDYCVQINGYFYKKLVANEELHLIDHSSVPGLYESFHKADQSEFIRLYEQAIQNPEIKKTPLKAQEVFKLIVDNRMQTGRVYIQNVDHTNSHSSFKDAVYMSNLCMEITLPTTPPATFLRETEYEVALCTLSAVNVGAISDDDELKAMCDLTVRFLDQLIEHQPYPTENTAKHSRARRSLGIGVTNLAYHLTSKGLKFDSLEGRNHLHQLFEALQYHCLTTSNQLAKEYGACDYFKRTKYSDQQLPIDHYHKNIDKYHQQKLLQDWEQLRADIKKYGLRNSTLTAQMPCESTAHLNNCTPGIHPPFNSLMHKSDKSGVITFAVPHANKYRYQHLWDIGTRDILLVSGIAQKFLDQSLSTNTHYNMNNYPNHLLPVKDLLKDILFAYTLGIKTLYYHHTKEVTPQNCESCSL